MPQIKSGKIVFCDICKTEVYRKGFRLQINKKHYCSVGCSYKGRKTGRSKLSKNCIYCNKVFYQKWNCGLPAWMERRYCSYECMGLDYNKKFSNNKAFSWKGGNKKFWNKQAKIRDDFTCRECGLREIEIMETDHIKPKSCFPKLVFNLNNLITLCPNCHRRKTIQDLKIYKFNQLRK